MPKNNIEEENTIKKSLRNTKKNIGLKFKNSALKKDPSELVGDILTYLGAAVFFVGVIIFILVKSGFMDLTQWGPQQKYTITDTDSDSDISVTVSPVRESATLDIPEGAYFATGNVNVRAEASSSSESLGILKKYDYVIVVAITDDNWAKVVYSDADSGFAYVYADYLSNDETFKAEAVAFLQELADDELASSGIVDTTDLLYDYEDIVSDLEALKAKYTETFSYGTYGTSADGRNLYYAAVGSANADNQIIIMGGLRANEYMASMVIMSQIQYYLDNYNYYYDAENEITYKDLLKDTVIYFIPTLNPDGMTISQYGPDALNSTELQTLVTDALGTSSYNSWKCNANGIDISRNFSVGFKTVIEGWTVGKINYPGTEAASEPEVSSLETFISSLSNVLYVASYRVNGERVYANANVNSDGSSISEDTLTVLNTVAEAMSEYSGYEIYSASRLPNGYETDYTTSLGIPSVLVAIGDTDAPLSSAAFYEIWNENKKLPAVILSALD